MAWILITPSSRGIGHALTRHLLANTPPSVPIVATTRSDKDTFRSSLLSNLSLPTSEHSSRLDIQHLDLLSEPSISALSTHCKTNYHTDPKTTHLRLAFFLPGMLHPEKSPSAISHTHALDTLKLNLLAPMLLIKHFHTFLPRKSTSLPQIPGLNNSAIMALMSARVGSISDNSLGGWYSYRASKAGVNQLVKTTDVHVKMNSGEKAMCVGMHPGTVKTGLSREFWGNVKEAKLFEPEYAAERLVEVLKGLEVDEARGGCWDWKGEEIPP